MPAKKKLDSSTEAKIKEAARKLFTQKGFSEVTTREIAAEAGINLALLNYYFRSKEKLFDIVMRENFTQFVLGIAIIFHDDKSSVEEKIDRIVSYYIDMIALNPDLPMFLLSEIRRNPQALADKLDAEVNILRTAFMKELMEKRKAAKLPPLHPLHIISNLIGMTVFPFVASPLLRRVGKVSPEEFNALMQERKKLIPVWLKAMLLAN
jgi:AcrR family transcriptional regulator